MDAPSCSASSLAVAEPLAGTATQARRWLLLETRGAWERDVDETELGPHAAALREGFDGRVLMIRRPERRTGSTIAFVAETAEEGGSIRRFRESADGFADDGVVEEPLLLVCCHGRRDRCCARYGPPVYDELGSSVAPEALWQSSHLGGHRFAANVLVLPAGLLLGRVEPGDVALVTSALAEGRIPLAHYRGRTMHAPELQAADAAVRQAFGFTGLSDVRVSPGAEGQVLVQTPNGSIDVTVVAEAGPLVVESCGKAPVPSVRYSVRW